MGCDFSKGRQPLVLFGAHSSSEDMDGYSFNFASESHQVGNTGPGGSRASHMVGSGSQQVPCSAAR